MQRFLDINMATLNKYIKIDDVATRLEFWYFVAFTWMISIGADILDIFIPGDQLSNIMSILLFVPSVSVAIRRMHDTDHSGLWLLVPIVNIVFLVSPSTASRWRPL
jgi:uncharacterized membrane protein YhaH (DUF805 family)